MCSNDKPHFTICILSLMDYSGDKLGNKMINRLLLESGEAFDVVSHEIFADKM